jgi:molybdopterin converting factor small subunit
VVTLRLFAHLREIAGTSRVELSGETVGEVLEAASEQFGERFAAGLRSAAIWRNGESASPTDPIAEGDELALIPPVSGGSTVMASGLVDSTLVVGLVGVLLLIGTNLASGQAWWTAGLVLLMSLWTVDVAARLEERGRQPATIGILLAIVLGVVSTHLLGGVGLGLTLFISVAAVLGWGVINRRFRELTDLAPSVVIALIATAGTGSLMLTRSIYEPDQHSISIFILIVGLAALVATVLDRLRAPVLDPYSGTALAAVLGGALGALLWGEDVVGYVLVGLGMAVFLVVGRSLGSILRTGQVALSDAAPGALGLLDGAIFAAVLYYPLVSLIL